MKKELIAYLREEGPICYETEIFDMNNRLALESLVKEMLSVELSWYWISARARPVPEETQYNFLPEERALTRLDSSSVDSFIDDLSERDEDGYGRFIAVFGFDKNIQSLNPDADQFKFAVNEFLEKEEAPLSLIIVQVGDSPWEHIYVSQTPKPPVKRLFNMWNIQTSAITWERSYKELHIAQVESLLDSIYKVATGNGTALKPG